VNEVQTMAKAGENIGSAVGTAVGTALMTARQGATMAGRNGAAASRRLARGTALQTRRRLAEHGMDRAQLKQLQDTFAENLWRARHELASKIEPPTHHRMPRLRLLMAIVMIAAIASAIASVISKRPLQQRDAERYRRSPDGADLSANAAAVHPLEPSQAEPSRPPTSPTRQAEPSRPPTSPTRQAAGRGLTGGNSSPAN
jgi:hypothetical protein